MQVTTHYVITRGVSLQNASLFNMRDLCSQGTEWEEKKIKTRLRVVSSFPPGDRRESSVERWESARKVGEDKKSERGSFVSFTPPPLSLFCLRPIFRALSHLSTLDFPRSPGRKEETTRSIIKTVSYLFYDSGKVHIRQ